MSGSIGLHILYKTALGRAVLKVLVQPKISVLGGKFMNSPFSKPLISYYINKHNIDMNDIEIPAKGFKSFNDFFTRKKKSGFLIKAAGKMISPCDGLLTCVPIRDEVVFSIKHTKFFMKDLLKDKALAEKFKDGTALIFRLTPSHYHRYCYVADGRIVKHRRIDGILHTVQPVATAIEPVYVQNSREYQIVETEKYGTVVQMEVGALMVGKISNHKKYIDNSLVWAGDEKGYFEFGGSTIVLLVQKDAVKFDAKIKDNAFGKEEYPIKIGDVIGC